MYVFRIHIRPQGGSASIKTTFDHCLRHGILGVGWRIASNRNTRNWDEYFAEASQQHESLNVCKYIRKWVSPGDLVWARDSLGNYYLARVTSGWEYWTTQESTRLDIDIANIFRCDIKRVGIEDVPGKVIACFRAGRSIQKIPDEKAKEYSKYLWNILSEKSVYAVDKAKYSDIFMLLDDEETEDLVFLYLQSKGWYVVPHSRKGDSMTFEYLCVNPNDGEVASTQVKTGNSFIDKDDYADLRQKIFLFQPNDRYTGGGAKHIECISREKLMEFVQEARPWLPGALRRKVEIGS